MPTPFKVLGGTGSSGVTSQAFNVATSTAAGDALVVVVGVGGTSPPTVTSVTDSKSNTYTLVKSVAASSPFVFVYAATGATTALSSGTPDTVTVHFSGSTTGAFGVIVADQAGVATVDVNTSASGSSTAPSVSGTPAQSGETAFGCFVWAAASLGGSVNSPLTQLDQEQSSGSVFTTLGYDVGPTSGVSLTASATLNVSAAWRVILITLEAAAAGPVAPFTPPARGPRGQVPARGRATGSYGAPVTPPPPPTPSPFTPPRRAQRGQLGARPGHFAGASRGAPVTPTPAPFTPPRRAARGLAPRRGRARSGLSSPGAPVTPPPVAPTLLVALASQPGTDDYGNSYPRGVQVGPNGPPQVSLLPAPGGVGSASELQFPITSASPGLFNTPNVAAGLGAVLAQLVTSGPAIGNSGVKDWVQQVLFSNDNAGHPARMEFRYISNAQVTTVTASYDSTGWEFGVTVTFNEPVEFADGLQVDGAPVQINQQTTIDANTFINGDLTVNGLAFIGDGSTLSDLNLSPKMATPPNFPTAGKTLAQTQAALDGLITSMENRGMVT